MDIQQTQTNRATASPIYRSNAILKLNNVSDDNPFILQVRNAMEEYNSPEAVEQRYVEYVLGTHLNRK